MKQSQHCCIGTARLQYFSWLSPDPNTIFQVFAFPDRLFFVKIGSVANQLPGLAHADATPVFLRELGLESLPSIDEARELVRRFPGGRLFGIPAPVGRSEELLLSDVRKVVHQTTGLYSRGFHFSFFGKRRRFYRWRDDEERAHAAKLLASVLGPRWEVRE